MLFSSDSVVCLHLRITELDIDTENREVKKKKKGKFGDMFRTLHIYYSQAADLFS